MWRWSLWRLCSVHCSVDDRFVFQLQLRRTWLEPAWCLCFTSCCQMRGVHRRSSTTPWSSSVQSWAQVRLYPLTCLSSMWLLIGCRDQMCCADETLDNAALKMWNNSRRTNKSWNGSTGRCFGALVSEHWGHCVWVSLSVQAMGQQQECRRVSAQTAVCLTGLNVIKHSACWDIIW